MEQQIAESLTAIPITQHEISEWFLAQGAKEYRDSTKNPDVRCFYLKMLSGIPVCSCNDRVPSLHIFTYPDIRLPTGEQFPGNVEFELCGEAGDKRWIKCKFYAVSRFDVPDFFPDVIQTARSVWTTFVNSIAHRALKENV